MGIFNIQDFNKALLGKWWWRVISDGNNCWFKIIKFNYLNGGPLEPLFHIPPRSTYFFWAGITPILPSFKFCSLKIVENGASTLFWHDNWLDDRAPKDIWHDLYDDCNFP